MLAEDARLSDYTPGTTINLSGSGLPFSSLEGNILQISPDASVSPGIYQLVLDSMKTDSQVVTIVLSDTF